MKITYDEFRYWARQLNVFTATELADVLGEVPYELGVQGCKALLYHGLVQDLDVDVDGPHGREPLYEYAPMPKGPKVHHTEVPPEIKVPQEYGGDPLKVKRGLPVPTRGRVDTSKTGQLRPGRRNMKAAERKKVLGR